MTSEPDRHYIERCLDGHRDDFRHLVRRYERPLMAGLRARRVRSEVAEEALQEAFCRAFAGLGRLRKPDSFFAWLLGIACRVLLEQAGRERREKAGLARISADARDLPPAPEPWEGDTELDAAVAGLSEPLREVVLLRFYGDCSCGEVAERLGIPIGTVTKRLSRAYEELRRSLGTHEPGRDDPCLAKRTENN